jgi:signal peptide peptidase SppA
VTSKTSALTKNLILTIINQIKLIQFIMDNNNQNLTIKPKIGGFLAAYIIFSLPGFLIGLISLLLVIILGIGAIAGASAAGAENPGSKLELKAINDSKSEKGVLIYDLTGAITSGNFESGVAQETTINTKKVKKDFEEIKKNENIKNVVFRMNTPGGEVFASELLGDLITDLQKSKSPTQPNIYFEQLAASGGLWASYKSNGYIVGSPYGQTGSIGVVLHIPNFKGLSEKVGYSETIIKSADSKDIGNPLRDITEEEKAYFQKELDVSYNRFKQLVKTSRKLSDIEVANLASGLVWGNLEAKQKGLIDQVGDIDILTSKAAKEVGLPEDYKVWIIEKKSNPIQELLSAKTFQGILGLQGIETITKTMSLKSGQAYAIDEMRI